MDTSFYDSMFACSRMKLLEINSSVWLSWILSLWWKWKGKCLGSEWWDMTDWEAEYYWINMPDKRWVNCRTSWNSDGTHLYSCEQWLLWNRLPNLHGTTLFHLMSRKLSSKLLQWPCCKFQKQFGLRACQQNSVQGSSVPYPARVVKDILQHVLVIPRVCLFRTCFFWFNAAPPSGEVLSTRGDTEIF